MSKNIKDTATVINRHPKPDSKFSPNTFLGMIAKYSCVWAVIIKKGKLICHISLTYASLTELDRSLVGLSQFLLF